jgi:uracil-DNA glycosylase
MNDRSEDRPRSLKYEEVREKRRKLLQEEPRVADLKKFVEHMREETRHGENIPHFDPLDGGVEARCLFLFEAAGGKAVESGFASRNNNDQSAENFFRLNKEEDFDRTLTASWNIVPWALRENNRNRKPTRAEVEEGERYLRKLMTLLRLEVVVLCGGYAQRAAPFFYREYPALCVLHAPHPSAQSLNQPGKREHLRAAIRKAASEVPG